MVELRVDGNLLSPILAECKHPSIRCRCCLFGGAADDAGAHIYPVLTAARRTVPSPQPAVVVSRCDSLFQVELFARHNLNSSDHDINDEEHCDLASKEQRKFRSCWPDFEK